MHKFSINYQDLSKSFDHLDKKVYKLSDVKHKLVKVGFDVFKMQNDPDNLWQIQSADDGEYIVAKYELDEPKEEKIASSWSVIVRQGEVSVFYKGHPITKIAAKSDAETMGLFLPKKLATDKTFVKALLNSLPDKDKLLQSFPELGK
jgi:hypothetical protein